MPAARVLILPLIVFSSFAAILAQWHWRVGFDPFDSRWWVWIVQTIHQTQTLPTDLLYPVYWTGAVMVGTIALAMVLVSRASARTVTGQRSATDLHGSARWAKSKDVSEAGLFAKTGVTVGGWPQALRTRTLRHEGPEHILLFAPTRSGKGVGVILPTLLSWKHSVLVLDIKGENYALTAGWRAKQGHRILRFEPTAETGSVRFNPLAEVRLDTGRDIADCQNIATMIIDPDGKGLKDYWMTAGFGWLTTVVLHVLYRVRRDDGRIACLKDVNLFMSAITDDGEGEDSFGDLLRDMMAFDHGAAHVNEEVKRGATAMLIKAPQERSGVHSSAATQLGLYADPIVAANTATSDFRLADLMNGPAPAALYLVIQPSDIDRLRPLVRVMMNIFLRRLTEGMEFEGGRSVAHYKHRLLLCLDEFTSIGKLEIFERALAFMAGYGLKALIVVQDLTQLQQAYGKEESIMSNCHVRLAYAPNKIETAKALSDMTGQTTIVQRKRSRSGRWGEVGSVSDNLHETRRPLLTADEILRLRLIHQEGWGPFKRTVPGQMLIFVAGSPPILGRQTLYFQDKELLARATLPPPPKTPTAPTTDTGEQRSAREIMQVFNNDRKDQNHE